jgi:hypothetical protein
MIQRSRKLRRALYLLLLALLGGVICSVYSRFPPAPRLTIHADELQGALFSPDGKSIALVEGREWESRAIRIFDAEYGSLRLALPNADSAPEEIAFSPNSALFAAYMNECVVKVWELKTGRVVQTLQVSCDWEGGRPAPQFTADSRHLILGNAPRNQVTVYTFWNLGSGSKEGELTTARLYIAPDGSRAAGFEDLDQRAGIKIWDIRDHKKPVEVFSKTLERSSFAVSPDARSITFIDEMAPFLGLSMVSRLDVETGAATNAIVLPGSGWSFGREIMPADDIILFQECGEPLGSPRERIVILNWKTGFHQVGEYDSSFIGLDGTWAQGGDPPDQLLIDSNRHIIYPVQGLKDELAKQLAESRAIFSPHGTVVAVIKPPREYQFPLPFLRDWWDRFVLELVSFDEQGGVELWSAKTRKPILYIGGFSDDIPIYSPEERHIAVMDGNGIRIWDIPPRWKFGVLWLVFPFIFVPFAFFVLGFWRRRRKNLRSGSSAS